MPKKQILLIGFAVALLAVYAIFFSGWFSTRPMQIEHSIRPGVPEGGAMGRIQKADKSLNVLTFAFDTKYELTSVKVVRLDQFQTNKYAHPLWQLVTASNTPAVKAIVYGGRIRGMQPKVKGAEPDPLEPNVAYKLIVEAGRIRGEHDFTPAVPVTTVKRVAPPKQLPNPQKTATK